MVQFNHHAIARSVAGLARCSSLQIKYAFKMYMYMYSVLHACNVYYMYVEYGTGKVPRSSETVFPLTKFNTYMYCSGNHATYCLCA